MVVYNYKREKQRPIKGLAKGVSMKNMGWEL
jgi:hypothetical protein